MIGELIGVVYLDDLDGVLMLLMLKGDNEL